MLGFLQMNVFDSTNNFVLDVSGLTIWLETPRGMRVCLVDKLNLNIQSGKTTALVGESGSGKSLTAHALMGLIHYLPHLCVEGHVFFEGHDLLSCDKHHMKKVRGKKITLIPQNPMSALNPVLSIGEQLIEIAMEHLTDNFEEAHQYSLEVLKEVHLPDPEQRLQDYPHQLSGGMRQRVLIAMAIMTHPQILIADEPTTALDVTVQRQILDLLHELQKRYNMAILLISHDISVVSYYADVVLVMYASQLVESGTCHGVLHTPQHPYTQGLLQSRPTWQAIGKPLKAIPGHVPSMDQLPSGCHFHPRCAKRLPTCSHLSPPTFLTTHQHGCKCWLYDGFPTLD